MSVEQTIRDKLVASFQPEFIELVNESHMHSVPKGAETHFKLLLVSDVFLGKSRIERQRLVNQVLAAELRAGVHALTQRIYTSAEWLDAKEKLNFQSPQCESKATKSAR